MSATGGIATDAESRSYMYTAYGLRVHSSIALPFDPCDAAADECARNADVRIRFGATPAELGGRARAQVAGIWESAPGAFVLQMDGVARFFVSNGTDIVIERDGGSDHDIAMSMLGSVLGALLQQRDIATFHASAFATSTGAVLFLGPSGTGKSTSLAAMTKRGYAMLADDLTGVVLDDDGRATALPAFPTMRLWKNSLTALKWQCRAERRVREGMARYLVAAPKFHRAPLAIRALFSVDTASAAGIEMRPGSVSTALSQLIRYSFRKRFQRRLRQEATQFRIASAMAEQVPLVNVSCPAEPLLPDALASRVDAFLNGDAGADIAVG